MSRFAERVAYTTLLALAALLLVLILATKSPAGWGGGSCGPVGPSAFAPAFLPPPAFAPAPVFLPPPAAQPVGPSWEGDGEGGYYCWLGEQQVGYLWPSGKYVPMLGPGRWGAKGEPPIARPAGARKKCCDADGCDCYPCKCKEKGRPCADGCDCVKAETAEARPRLNFGLNLDQIGKRGPRCILNGKEVTRGQAFEAIEASVPDDRGRPKLTVIGAEADRKRVMADLDSHPSLAAFKDRLVVQAYDPADPILKGLGYPAGSPSVIVQRADGAIIGRNKDGQYKGPEWLAQALPVALRRAEPGYDPASDPELKPPPPPAPPAPPPPPPGSWPDLSKIPPCALLLGGVGAVLLVLTLTRKEGQ